MTGVTLSIGNKKLLVVQRRQKSIPEKIHGLIFPHYQGMVITDDRGEARLLIVTETGCDFCWFVSGRPKAGKYRISHTTFEDEKEFGLDKLKYSEIIDLATRLHQKCQKYLCCVK